jgi:putative spermidine/putrescine transport system ATP-binding protein
VLDGSIASGDGLALVRPESLSVERCEGANGTLVSRSFLGPVSRVVCDLDGGGTVTAQLSSTVATELVTGDRVEVAVSPSPVLVVPAD